MFNTFETFSEILSQKKTTVLVEQSIECTGDERWRLQPSIERKQRIREQHLHLLQEYCRCFEMCLDTHWPTAHMA